MAVGGGGGLRYLLLTAGSGWRAAEQETWSWLRKQQKVVAIPAGSFLQLDGCWDPKKKGSKVRVGVVDLPGHKLEVLARDMAKLEETHYQLLLRLPSPARRLEVFKASQGGNSRLRLRPGLIAIYQPSVNFFEGYETVAAEPVRAVVRYVGPLHGQPGHTVGLQLPGPPITAVPGKDGTLEGRQYFTCNQGRAVFCDIGDVVACHGGEEGEAQTNCRRILVDNLPSNCTEAELVHLFSEFGKVVTVETRVADQVTDLMRNYGYVEFETAEAVCRALESPPVFLYGYHRVFVNFFTPHTFRRLQDISSDDGPRSNPPTRQPAQLSGPALVVSGVDNSTVSESKLIDALKRKSGELEDMTVKFDTFVAVKIKEIESMKQAIETLTNDERLNATDLKNTRSKLYALEQKQKQIEYEKKSFHVKNTSLEDHLNQERIKMKTEKAEIEASIAEIQVQLKNLSDNSTKEIVAPDHPNTDGEPESHQKQLILWKINFIQKQIEEKENKLECPVCFHTANGEIFMCSAQHLICSVCCPKLSRCPQCQEPFEGRIRRHRLAEEMVEERNKLVKDKKKLEISIG